MKNLIFFLFSGSLCLFITSSVCAQVINPTKPGELNTGPIEMGACFGPPSSTSGAWKPTGNKSIYWDGVFVGICTKNPTAPLHVNSSALIKDLSVESLMLPDHRGGLGDFYLGGKTDKKEDGMRLFGGKTIKGGYIDVRASDPNSGLRFRVDNRNGGTQRMIIKPSGKIAIGYVNTPGDYRLYVQKGILTERLKIAQGNSAEWADFVFADDYQLCSLAEVEQFIQNHKHLPEIPSAEEVRAEGIDMAAMDAKLLQKIEELTLYLIDQNKRIKLLEKQNKALTELLQTNDKQ